MERRYPHQPVVTVGGVVFRDDGVLLVQRAKPPNRGVWAIPGGRVRLGETLAAACERELREETGVRTCARRPIYSFDTIERDPVGRVRYHYVIVDLLADYLGGIPKAGDDALDARWVRAAELDALPVSGATLDFLREWGFLSATRSSR